MSFTADDIYSTMWCRPLIAVTCGLVPTFLHCIS